MVATEIKPGMFGLSVIGGRVGRLVRIGQRIVERHDYTYTHAFLVVDNERVIEAEPGGAIFSPLTKYLGRSDVIFSDLPVQLAVHNAVTSWDKIGYSFEPGTADQAFEAIMRRRVTRFGRMCEGVPYNYLDYFSLALEHFHISISAVEKRVKREDRMICSQLVDWAYMKCGIHLFDDGRLPQDVTPGDLEKYIEDNNDYTRLYH